MDAPFMDDDSKLNVPAADTGDSSAIDYAGFVRMMSYLFAIEIGIFTERQASHDR